MIYIFSGNIDYISPKGFASENVRLKFSNEINIALFPINIFTLFAKREPVLLKYAKNRLNIMDVRYYIVYSYSEMIGYFVTIDQFKTLNKILFLKEEQIKRLMYLDDLQNVSSKLS